MSVPAMLADADYERFRLLIRETCGLAFDEARRPDLELAVAQTSAELGLPDPEALFTQVASDRNARAFDCLVAHLTVGETYFFRNRPQFEALERDVLPELIARRRPARRLRLWSAGCASGEEPYSLAILLRRLVPDLADWDVLILATDINRAALERAQRGAYEAWSFREPPDPFREAYFCRRGSRWEIAPEIRRQVTFAQLNLAEDTYPSPLNHTQDMDLILFRNVLIYFDPETTRAAVARLHRSLAAGGWLVVGHAEPSQAIFGQFAARHFPGAVLYQKAEANAMPRRMLTAPDPGPQRRATRQTFRWRSQKATPEMGGIVAPTQDAPALLREAKAAADRSQFGAAQRLVEEALRQAPLMAPAHYLLALILEETGQTEAALDALRRCIYSDPQHVLGHLGLARLCAAGGQPARARACRANALRLLDNYRPEDPVADGDGLTAGRLLGDLAAMRSDSGAADR